MNIIYGIAIRITAEQIMGNNYKKPVMNSKNTEHQKSCTTHSKFLKKKINTHNTL